MTERRKTDFLIIGSGVAGLYTAVRAAAHGSTILVTKGRVPDSNTYYAQGGIAAAISESDSPQDHLSDTLQAGAGLCLEEAVEVLVSEGPRRIFDLISLGTRFDRLPSGELMLGKEAAHSHRRIVHARGDATGAELIESLAAHARQVPNLTIIEECLALELLISDDRCVGAIMLPKEGSPWWCMSRATVLATGGCGQLYSHTTNPTIATGDGQAMALRAGAYLFDMEFVQFHPTALATEATQMPLISEAVRGEGARLLNAEGIRFMSGVHPWQELAPRDVVARAIFAQMQQGSQVYLDATHLGENFPSRFPGIFAICMERGIDPRRELISVAPAAHFIMGGVRTDLNGATSVPGLFACGEVACTGVHGANRLASNSLLEGLVFAERVAQTVKNAPFLTARAHTMAKPAVDPTSPPSPSQATPAKELIQELQKIMWDNVGIERSASSLEQAIARIDSLAAQDAAHTFPAYNMLTVAKAIAGAALMREESRGGHYRKDFPVQRQQWQQRRIAVHREGMRVVSATNPNMIDRGGSK